MEDRVIKEDDYRGREEHATETEIKCARDHWASDDLEIDDHARVSRDTETNTGYWVAAWVWIDDNQQSCS